MGEQKQVRTQGSENSLDGLEKKDFLQMFDIMDSLDQTLHGSLDLPGKELSQRL